MKTRLLLVASAIAASLAVGFPLAADAACSSYDIGNIKFAAAQSNGFALTFQFQQNGTKLEGHAVYRMGSGENSSGPLYGSITGETFSFTVHWGGGADGKYSGRITNKGGLEGTTGDANNPASRASWSTTNNPYPIKCLTEAAAPPSSGGKSMTKKKAKPMKQMGKPRTLTSRDTDIYDNPGGEVIGILRAGRGAEFLNPIPTAGANS